ncbi:hypothetical protein CsSME_00035333 [Camellia sinensis var. sinensis]
MKPWSKTAQKSMVRWTRIRHTVRYSTRNKLHIQSHFSDEEGTLWWHAHSDWTQSSVHGAIIIMPAQGTTYPFPQPDAEQVIVLGTWYTFDVNKQLHYDLFVGADLPRPSSFVINGQPGGIFNCSSETQYRLYVDYGKTYLLRLINAAVSSELFFAIADHNVTVVGMDGNYLEPISTSYLVISPGQTVNALLTANQPLGYYYMAIRQYVTNGYPDVYPPNTAIVEYRGNYTPPSSPVFLSKLPSYINITQANACLARLRSLAGKEHPVSVPINITHPMYIVVSVAGILCNKSQCEIGMQMGSATNNMTFLNPSTDVLLAYYRNISGVYSADFPDFPLNYYNFTGDNLPNSTAIPTIATMVKMLNYNETVQVVFQESNVLRGAENHPMHMHGYSFYVVGSGPGSYDNVSDPNTFNLVDPQQVNTFRVPKNGWVAIRFQANNPGVWMRHCHVIRHLTWGMVTAFIVRDGGTPETSMLDPPPSMPSCGSPFRNYIHEFQNSEKELPLPDE